MDEIATAPISVSSPSWFSRLSPQAVFVLVAGFFGLAMAFVTPPVEVPDEQAHWFRVYQLSQGKLLSQDHSCDVPWSIAAYAGNLYAQIVGDKSLRTSVTQIREEFKKPLQPDFKTHTIIENTALYSIVPYAPQTLAMFIARKSNWPAIGLMYAGRVGTVIGYVLLGWLSIRIMPILKWSACMIMASPMALFLAGSLSADPISTALVVLATALLLKCIFSPVPLTGATIISLFFVMILVALCKAAYFPVVFLAFGVPLKNWGPGYRRWIYPIALCLVTVGTFLAWSKLAKADDVKEQGDGVAIMKPYLLHHPKEFMAACRKTIVEDWEADLCSCVSGLGWLDVTLWRGVVDVAFIALAWVTLAYDQPLKLRWWPRVLAAAAVVASVGLIYAFTYMVWNHVGSPRVEGIQGRYFLPIGVLACMIFRRKGSYPVQPKWMIAFLSCLAIYAVWTLLERYYIPPGYSWRILSGT